MSLSSPVINEILGRFVEPQNELEVTNNQVCSEITGGRVKYWPNKGKFSVGKLTVKYGILHRVAVVNCVPTNHTSTITKRMVKRQNFDFGSHIFNQILKQDFSSAVKFPIYFPSLIWGIILN